MRYCNLKFGYNKASVKSATLQNCTGKKKHTLAKKTTQKPTVNLYCDQTTPWQGVYYFTNTIKVGVV